MCDIICKILTFIQYKLSHQPSSPIYLGDNDGVKVAHASVGHDRDQAMLRSDLCHVRDNPASCVKGSGEVDEKDVAAHGSRKEWCIRLIEKKRNSQ